jgi:hypothetical protein
MLEEILHHVSFLTLAIVAVVSYVLFDFVRGWIESRRIARLGARAPRRRYLLPFGLDVVYGGVRSVVENRVLEYFEEGMMKYANPNRPYTVEFRVGMEYPLCFVVCNSMVEGCANASAYSNSTYPDDL